MKGKNIKYSSWFLKKNFVFFLIAWCVCSLLFGYIMPLQYALVAFISTFVFFIGSNHYANIWSTFSEKDFLKKVFLIGFFIRFIWVLYCYLYFNESYYGQVHGDGADCDWYMSFAKNIVNWIHNGFNESFNEVRINNRSAIDDVGYPIWLSLQYLIFGIDNDTFVPFLVKCIVSSYCSISIYKIGNRHFGNNVAKLAAIFLMFNPNMIYWCGTMFKEPEMLFILCLFINKADEMLCSRGKLTFQNMIMPLLFGISLFFFRSVIAIVGFAAILIHVLFSPKKIVATSKKITISLFFAGLLLIFMGDSLKSQSEHLIELVQSDGQEKNMDYRSYRDGGNSLAIYASAVVFAPLIFTIPFPTFNVANEAQILQLELSGGSFIKNIFSFLVIYVLFRLLLNGEWKKHSFIIAFMCGYLVALVFSNFAQSGRFHLPIIPFIILFGTYGLSIFSSNRKFQDIWVLLLCVEIIICIAWNAFKLIGRGLL